MSKYNQQVDTTTHIIHIAQRKSFVQGCTPNVYPLLALEPFSLRFSFGQETCMETNVSAKKQPTTSTHALTS